MDTLSAAYDHRKGQVSGSGSTKTDRRYIDFLVSGQSLREILNQHNSDLIGVLGWTGNHEFESQQINEFLGLVKPELATRRTSFYVCPECGDIGCGAITARIEFSGNHVVWKDFGHETNYSAPELSGYSTIGPFMFDRRAYIRFFEELRKQIGGRYKNHSL